MSNEKVAFVTGASRGIGLEIARQLVDCGWNVGMSARREQILMVAAEDLDSGMVHPVACDVSFQTSISDAMEEVAARFGPISALVNNAGVIDPVGLMHETDPVDWMRLMQINIWGVMLASRAVVPTMVAQGRGVIVNLSSGAAHNPVEGWSAYCTSKAGLAMFSRCLAAEYGPQGIRVHDFIPGVVDTDMLNGAQKKFDNAVARLDDEAKLTPDIPARCVAWLVDQGEGQVEGVEQTIRDPEFRKKVGLEERSQW